MILARGAYTVVDLNDIDISIDKPTSPVMDQLWLDKESNILYRYDGTKWVEVTKDTYTVNIISSNGAVFKTSSTTRSTTLIAKVYKNGTDITNEVASRIIPIDVIWTRKSKDNFYDTTWNSKHTVHAMSVDITSFDISLNAIYTCTLYIN
jgi:hypothetical protein